MTPNTDDLRAKLAKATRGIEWGESYDAACADREHALQQIIDAFPAPLDRSDRVEALEGALECIILNAEMEATDVEDKWHEGFVAGYGDAAEIARQALPGEKQ